MHEAALAGGRTLDDALGVVSTKPIAVLDAALLANSDSAVIMKFDTLVPVGGPQIGSAGEVRGIASGGLPWALEAGSGSLSCEGHLIVRIRGLVLAADPLVPASMQRRNPFPAFRVVVSCLRPGQNGSAVVANVSTGDFEASVDGNSDIDARVSLPQPCTAPIVLVTGPSGTSGWLAVTGR